MANPQPKTDMEAFYASLESETSVPSHSSLSEETNKAIKILQGLISKDFYHLFHPGRSTVMKDTLKYLLNLPPHEGFSITTKSEIKRLLQRFTQLECNYSHMFRTKSSKAVEKIRNELDANIKEFREIEKEDKCLHILLASLEEEKAKLEEKINAVKIEIANSIKQKDVVANRKTKVFDEGTVLKARRDVLLIDEYECANIEVEWLFLRDQFIRKTCFNEWI